MAQGRAWLQELRSVQLVEVSSSPFENGARSARGAISLLQEHGVEVNLVSLRWFQNVGLINGPAKEGRNAVYPRGILDEVASLRVLQNLYGRSIEDLKVLRRRRITFTEVVQHLLRLERDQSDRVKTTDVTMISPGWERALERLELVNEFFERVMRGRVHPGNLVLKGRALAVVTLGVRRGK